MKSKSASGAGSLSRRSFVTGALVAGQLLSLALPALAAAPVRMAGQQVFAVNTAGGVSDSSRAATIQRNLDNALVATTNRTPQSVNIVYVKGQPVLTVGGFYVATVDATSAKQAGVSPAVLAGRWAGGLKKALADRAGVDHYIAQISGDTSATVGTTSSGGQNYNFYKQGRIVYVPAGMTIPIALSGSLSSASARAGDPIEAVLTEDLRLGDTIVPRNSRVLGTVSDAKAGARLSQSGLLGIKFNTLVTPDGVQTPITAHLTGGIGKYEQITSESNLVKGETVKSKTTKALLHGAVGAGGGALLGTAIGAIAGHGRGAGRGAVAGLAIGSALGVAEGLLVSKAADVVVPQGQRMTLKLDAPAQVSGTATGAM